MRLSMTFPHTPRFSSSARFGAGARPSTAWTPRGSGLQSGLFLGRWSRAASHRAKEPPAEWPAATTRSRSRGYAAASVRR